MAAEPVAPTAVADAGVPDRRRAAGGAAGHRALPAGLRGGCGATRPRSAFGALFLVDRACCACSRRSTRSTSRTPAPTPTTSPTRSRSAASTSTSSRPTGIPIGPDLARALLPRRRPERPRRRRAPALRRAQLARDRLRRDADHDGAGDAHRAPSPATSAAAPTASSAACSTSSGPIPVVLLGDRARHVAGARRPQPRACSRCKGNSLMVPGGDHRRRLRPVRRQAAARAGARPARAGVRRRRARCRGSATLRIMASEILPNLASTIIVFIPLIIANAILLEAGLSYLGAGVQPPNPSWGTMISDGIRLIPSAIHLTFVPGPDARARRARRSTSSATACATRSTRAPRCAWSTDGPLHRPPALLDGRGADRDLDPDVPDLPGDPERRPGAAPGRAASRRPRRSRRSRKHVGLRQADLRPVPADDEARSSRARSSPTRSRSTSLDADQAATCPRRSRSRSAPGIIWLGAGHRRSGCSARVTAGSSLDRCADRARADRRLDAGVLPRRDAALLPRVQGRDLPATAATSR